MNSGGFWATYFCWLPIPITPEFITHCTISTLWPFTPPFWLGPDTITFSIGIIPDNAKDFGAKPVIDLISYKIDISNGIGMRQSKLQILDKVYYTYKAPGTPVKPLIFVNPR
jgi:hypothetical protein